jgi:hypothetical protein
MEKWLKRTPQWQRFKLIIKELKVSGDEKTAKNHRHFAGRMWVLGTTPHYLVFVVSKGEGEPLPLRIY